MPLVLRVCEGTLSTPFPALGEHGTHRIGGKVIVLVTGEEGGVCEWCRRGRGAGKNGGGKEWGNEGLFCSANAVARDEWMWYGRIEGEFGGGGHSV